MKKILGISGAVMGATIAGVMTYTLINKKTRKKAMELVDTMIEEAKTNCKDMF